MESWRERETLIRNSAKCLKCDDEIVSEWQHDFKYCSCGNIFVDGGLAYTRHGFHDKKKYKDTSVYESSKTKGRVRKTPRRARSVLR